MQWCNNFNFKFWFTFKSNDCGQVQNPCNNQFMTPPSPPCMGQQPTGCHDSVQNQPLNHYQNRPQGNQLNHFNLDAMLQNNAEYQQLSPCEKRTFRQAFREGYRKAKQMMFGNRRPASQQAYETPYQRGYKKALREFKAMIADLKSALSGLFPSQSSHSNTPQVSHQASQPEVIQTPAPIDNIPKQETITAPINNTPQPEVIATPAPIIQQEELPPPINSSPQPEVILTPVPEKPAGGCSPCEKAARQGASELPLVPIPDPNA